jgi:Flp pilus assembly protein TadG
MRLFKDNHGQATVLTVLFIGGLLGIAALVLDVGSWFRESRATQATADAAALAGAQALPDDPGTATNAALTWANKNGGGAAGADVTITSEINTNDTISVKVKRNTPSFFSKLFGVNSADVDSTATARISGIAAARYVAPVAVPEDHPGLTGNLSGKQCPCFGTNTQLDLGPAGAPGAFHLINLDASHGGTGQSILSNWIQNGFDQDLPLGGYFSDTGAKWNASEVQNAFGARMGTDLLFPVYDTIDGTGSNATYHVIGWVGFHLTGIDARGSDGDLKGWFTKVLWQGLQAVNPGQGGPNFGAQTIQLIH